MNKKFLSAILFGALMITSTGTFVSCKDYDDDINDLQSQVDTNVSAVDALKTQLASLQSAAAAAQATADAAKAAADAAKKAGDDAKAAAEEAKAAAAQAKADAIADATAKVEALKALVDTNKVSIEELEALIGVISGQIEGIETGLSDLKALVASEDAKILAEIAAVKADLEEQLAALQAGSGEIPTEVIEAIQGLQAQIDSMTNNQIVRLNDIVAELDEALKGHMENFDAAVLRLSEQIAATNEVLDEQAEQLKDVWFEALDESNPNSLKNIVVSLANSISDINANLSTMNVWVKGRLTSLLFAPTLYVDGIEAIPFTTLKYLPWNDLKADDALASHTTAPDSVAISDNSTEAFYYVSPSNVDLTSIAKLNVLVQKDAQNIQSRAAAPEIEATMGEVVDGKMAVNFKKNATASFGAKGNKFSVMALQAELTKEEGEETATLVTSDWARIYETHVVPYIHKANAETENAGDAHFWTYAQIHSNNGNVVAPDAVCNTQYNYIAKELVYSEETNLFDLVDVCDKNGMSLDYKDFGMTFEFALMDYYLQSNNEEKTNQALFAKIDENGTITSCSYNGVANNQDAIGREPMIQAVLKDTVNNKVVDVRYFKIKWIAKDEQMSLGHLAGFTNEFDCGKEYKDTIGTEIVNVKIYTALNMSKEYFHNNYYVESQLFASLEDLKEGESDQTLGTLSQINAQASSTTINYEWKHTVSTITDADYNAGKIVKTAYGFFYNHSNIAEKHYFTLTDTIVIPQMGITGYVATQWNKTPVANDGSKIFQVNPALTSDPVNGITNFYDCQMTANFLKGYNNKDVAPANLTIANITNDAVTAEEFVFDAERIAEVLGEGWSVSTDGKQLLKGEDKEIAAIIEETNISLYENPKVTSSAHGEPTDAAQALLDKQVPVKLVGENCAGIEKTLDKFLVHFIDPLKMEVNQEETTLKDLITGSSKVDVSKAVQIFEKFGLKRGVVYLDKDGNLVKDPELVKWYNVGTVTWDIANAKTNLKLDGNNLVIDGANIAHSWEACENYYQLKVNDDATELSFHNNSGSHIQQEFKVAVPVYVQTKWNPALADPTKATVILTIKPGDYE